MNEIIKAVYKSEMPKLTVRLGLFKSIDTGQLKTSVTQVNNYRFVYDARYYTKENEIEIEGTERIMDCLLEEMINQMEKKE